VRECSTLDPFGAPALRLKPAYLGLAALGTVTIGVLIASAAVGTTHAHLDYFRADKAWFYIVLLTIAYMVSRGLAKSGSREHYNAS